MAVRSKEVELAPSDLIGKPVDVSLETAWGQRRTWNALVHRARGAPAADAGAALLPPGAAPRGVAADPALGRAHLARQDGGGGGRDAAAPSTGWRLRTSRAWCSPWSRTTTRSSGSRRTGTTSCAGSRRTASSTSSATRAARPARWPPPTGCTWPTTRRAGGPAARRPTAARCATRWAPRTATASSASCAPTRCAPGARAGRDWNFLTPSYTPEGATPTLHTLPRNGGLELFDYPSLGGWGPEGRASEGIEAGTRGGAHAAADAGHRGRARAGRGGRGHPLAGPGAPLHPLRRRQPRPGVRGARGHRGAAPGGGPLLRDRHRRAGLRLHLRGHALARAAHAAPRDAAASHRRPADRGGGRPCGRGDPPRRARADQAVVPLGPASREGRHRHLLGAGGPVLGRAPPGAPRSSRASAWRCWSPTSTETPTGRS